MNKKLPFEELFEQQMNHLQSPNEDESWQKMKSLLDEKGKRKPFVLFNNYKTLAILILLLLTGFFFLINERNSKTEEPVATAEKTTVHQQKTHSDKAAETAPSTITVQQNSVTDASLKHTKKQGKLSHKLPSTISGSTNAAPQKLPLSEAEKINSVTSKNGLKRDKTKVRNNTAGNQTTASKVNVSNESNSLILTQDKGKNLPATSSKKEVNDTSANIESNQQSKQTIKHKDTLMTKEIREGKDSAAAQITVAKTKSTCFVSAGIGVQQQVPVAGQKAVAYGYNGTTSTLSDYIPSVYIRVEKDKKWFLQGEFLYAAPQLVKAFSYNRKTQADNSTGTITTTNLRLRKTFYNALPISFNYYIAPNWYAGAGGVYSWFHGAIAEREITTSNVLTQTQSVVKQIVPIAGYTDSFLYKSHTYVLLQTGYNWRRLSAGLRYTKDVQPYIKYTLPDGTISDEKNWSLEFILRFRLFKGTKL